MSGPQMQLEDWLDDLCVRFIINLPEEDLSTVERICFQVEEAQWFYEDFIRPLDPSLPSMTLRTFCLRIFQHCPLLAPFSIETSLAAFGSFLDYKTRIPVRGAILLNHDMDSVVLVKGWKKGANWSFPRGKINKDEDDLDCAIREVYEETGMDLRAHGLVPTTSKPKYIEITMREQQLRLYVFRDVPMDYNFQPQTRKEISKIQWYKLSELPTFRKKNAQNQNESVVGANKFYMVAPFLVPLKKWVTTQKRQQEKRVGNMHYHAGHAQLSVDEGHTEDETYATDQGAHHLQQAATIASLDGATKELQRLLKLQPPMQGLQPAMAQRDKGSALLSILQSSEPSVPSNTLQLDTRVPHTPQDLTIIDPPQPQNPHHHTNQQHAMPLHMDMQQQPPPFPLPYGSEIVPQHFQQHQQYQQYPAQAAPYGHPGAPHHQSQKSIPLVHPQPLPPQVQRAMFNSSVFQEAAAKASTSLPQPAFHPWHQPGAPQPNAPPPQQQRAAPMQLTGQSMALLNAFKREPSGSQQPPPMPPAMQQLSQQQPQQHLQVVEALNMPASGAPGQNLPPPPPYTQYPAQQQPAQQQRPLQAVPVPISSQAMPPQAQFNSHTQPQNQLQPPVGVRNPPLVADQHRSALLGMFKKTTGPQSPVPRASSRQGQPPSPSGFIPELSSPSQRKLSSDVPVELGMCNMSIQPAQAVGPSNGHVQHSSQPSPTQQRGSNLTAVPPPHTAGGSIASPYAPYISQSHQPQQPSPPAQPSAPIPVGAEQKRQLLSLFGSGAGGPAVATAAGKASAPQLHARSPLSGVGAIHEMGNGNPAPRDHSRSRIASLASASVPGEPGSGNASRRGSQTPISPADESFLLGYLQSVTKTA